MKSLSRVIFCQLIAFGWILIFSGCTSVNLPKYQNIKTEDSASIRGDTANVVKFFTKGESHVTIREVDDLAIDPGFWGAGAIYVSPGYRKIILSAGGNNYLSADGTVEANFTARHKYRFTAIANTYDFDLTLWDETEGTDKRVEVNKWKLGSKSHLAPTAIPMANKSAALSADDQMPLMNDRPDALKPSPLPPNVKYVFASDATVVAAAKRLEKYLASDNVDGAAMFKDSLFVLPGAWTIATASSQFGKTDATMIKNMIPLGGKLITFSGCVMGNAEEMNKLGEYIKQLIINDGGATIRTLNSAEMAKWWIYIGFNIVEPVFAAESKGGKYVFIFAFSSKFPDCLNLIDELKTLPDAYDLRSSALEQQQ